MSKILANEIANYGDDAPIDLKEGLNIPAGKPIQAAGSTGTTGQVLSTTGTSIQWVTPFSGSYTDLTNKPTIPSAQVNADWNSSSGVSAILNKPVVPPLSSVVTASAGTAALSFNSANGQFTYTPPDLSSFATTTSLTTAVANSSNWDTAYGWGDHSSAGYLTAETSTLAQVLTRSSTTVLGFGSFGGTAWSANASPTGSNNVLFTNLALFENDVYLNLTGDKVKWGWLSGSMAWCGEGGTFETDWSDEKFELIHWDSVRPTGANYGIQGALYFKSKQGYPISIGNDTGDIQLGNNDGSVKYLTASSTATKLFLNGVEKLSTTASGVTITGSLTAGGLTYPTSNGNSGQILTSDGAGNVTWQDGGSGNTQVSISDTIPAGSASAGDLWWESDTGRLKIYYQDTDSAQWVDVNPPLRQDRIASTGAPSSATDTGVAGDIRYDSGYVYIAVATNTWKRAALTTW